MPGGAVSTALVCCALKPSENDDYNARQHTKQGKRDEENPLQSLLLLLFVFVYGIHDSIQYTIHSAFATSRRLARLQRRLVRNRVSGVDQFASDVISSK